MSMKWCACSFSYKYFLDGEPVDGFLLDEILKYYDSGDESAEAFRARVSVCVGSFEIVSSNGERISKRGGVMEFFETLHALRADYAFFADSITAFSFVDYAIHRDNVRTWERAETRAEIMQNNARYKKITGNKFEELSGENGQRYYFKIWISHKNESRHVVTRGFTLYGFNNIFNDSAKKYESAEKLFFAVSDLDRLTREETGVPFLGEKEPLYMTAGGLAKYSLLKNLYGSDSKASNIKKYRSAHKMTVQQYRYLYDRKINRGGICFLNPKFSAKEINEKIYKYDRNSSYGAEAFKMRDIIGARRVETRGLPCGDYVYIFSFLHLKLKQGKASLFFHPYNGQNGANITIEKEFAIFSEELREIEEYYTIQAAEVAAVLELERGGEIYAPYAMQSYAKKAEAKANGGSLYDFRKILNNSAWGKLSERADFPRVTHEINEETGIISQYVEIEAAERPSLSILNGAYINALARVRLMQAARAVCKNSDMLDTLVYTDTDSIHAKKDCAGVLDIGVGLGQWKFEHGAPAVRSVYADRKAYINIFENGEREYHLRGIPKNAVEETIKESFGFDNISECPDDVFVKAFLLKKYKFVVPFSANVSGGRCILYTRKNIKESVYKKVDGAQTVYYGGEIIEI